MIEENGPDGGEQDGLDEESLRTELKRAQETIRLQAELLTAILEEAQQACGSEGLGLTMAQVLQQGHDPSDLRDRIAQALSRATRRTLGPHWAFKVERAIDRVLFRQAKEAPSVDGGFVAWRSKKGARKHEIVAPAVDPTRVSWERWSSQGNLGARAPRRAALVDCPDLAILFEGWQLVTGSSLGEVLDELDSGVELLIASEETALGSMQPLKELTERGIRVALFARSGCAPEAASSGLPVLGARLGVPLPENAAHYIELGLAELVKEQGGTAGQVRVVPPNDQAHAGTAEIMSPLSQTSPAAVRQLVEAMLARHALRLAPTALGWQDSILRGLSHCFLESPEGIQGGSLAEGHEAWRFARERFSVPAARARLSAGLGIAPVGPGEPLVSVLCVSRRPGLLKSCIETFRRQSYERKELILVANLDTVDQDLVDQCQRDASILLLRTQSDMSLGQSLNRARAVARGDLWAKMDDDDYYGAHYLRDAVLAMQESRAAVVGKGTYFRFVEQTGRLYLTSEAPENAPSERFVHGGTIVADRTRTHHIDFLPVKKGTDTLFLQQCKLAGLPIYSADRFNFAYIRYAQPGHHTFDVAHTAYLRHSLEVASSLDRGVIDA
ncbi:MAG: hypothetical protein B6A08_14225 [Sorangiineae bacterium NIC37A_2]|nr:MAG: hypothetical protein B6A08_14225 [Sorangiineae bacterium NIC37A_2]